MIEKEELERIVGNSGSFSEVLRKMNKSISGASVKVLKDTLDAYEIDYHFLYERNPQEKRSLKNIPIEEILVENSPYPRKYVKQRLIESGLKQNVCECCGCNGLWRGMKLTMQLHHLNGNNRDNRLENLKMYCPNCHSQTETYGGGNFKKTNYCADCGKIIGNRSTYCNSCAAKKKNKRKVENRPSKEELFEMIRKMPFTKIGQIYGVSDRAIAKWCRAYNLPSTRKKIKETINGPLV